MKREKGHNDSVKTFVKKKCLVSRMNLLSTFRYFLHLFPNFHQDVSYLWKTVFSCYVFEKVDGRCTFMVFTKT